MKTALIAGREAPLIGLGTFGLDRAPRDQAVAALRRGLDLGMTHIDTAEMYGSGRVEELVGEAIAGRRDQVFLVSKVLPSNGTRSGVIDACARSLRRLRTDRLDLYLLHWPGPHPLAETVAGFEELRAAGRIRAWGVSNFDATLLQQAVALGPVACDQVAYHLEDRSLERELAPLARRHAVALVGYTPFAGVGGNAELQRLATASGKTPHQLALAFLSRRAFAIPKAASLAHVEENAAAGELLLSDEEERAIDALSRSP